MLKTLIYDFTIFCGVFNMENESINYKHVRLRVLPSHDNKMESLKNSVNSESNIRIFKNDIVRIAIAEFLENNSEPENRYYLYHFFYDNCATRIRDLMLQTFPGITLPESQESPTFRDLIHRCVREHPWGQFGIDIALGLPTDQKTGMYEQMFLPDYVFDAFANVLYQGRPVVKETKTIFVPDRPAFQPPGPFTPTVLCCLILALAVLFLYVQNGSKAFDFTLFFVVGLVGVLITFLWFFTDHTNTVNNLNIIWALPTHLVMAFFLLPRRYSAYTRYYYLVTAIIAMLLVVSWIFLPQKLNPSLIPLVLSVALRAFRVYRTLQ